jgi:hypothetical protein
MSADFMPEDSEGMKEHLQKQPSKLSLYGSFAIVTSSGLHFASAQSTGVPLHVQSCNAVSEGQQ